MSDITVLYIVGTLERGGIETLVRDWCRTLHGDGVQCTVLCIGEKRGPFVAEIEAMAVPVLELRQTGTSALGFVAGLVRAVRRSAAQVVHSQCAWSIPQQAMAARLGGAAGFVLTVHNVYPSGTRWQRLRRLAGMRLTAPLVHEITAVSEGVAAHARSWLGPPGERIRTVRNGIVLEQFNPPAAPKAALRAQLGLHGEGPWMVNVASLSEKKDQATLLRAFAEVRNGLPSARLVFAGDGPLRSNLESLSRDLQLDGAVAFLGERADVSTVLQACDLFVLSSAIEGLPLALVEAHAAGLPAVVTDVGGVTEVVRPGESGLVVPPGDPEALASALQSLLQDPERARSMGMAGREIVLKEFDASRSTAEYLSIYHEAARRGRS